MKYLGGLIMTILILLSVGLITLIIANSYKEPLSLERVFLLIVFFLMIPFCTKGAFYFFKYAGSFIKSYEIRIDGIKVKEKNRDNWFPIESIKNVLYLRALKVFEINIHDYPHKLVLMNNGQVETNSFINLKEFFFKNYEVKSKWF